MDSIAFSPDKVLASGSYDEESNEEESDFFVEDVSVEIKEDILFDQQSSSDDLDEEDEP